MAEIVPFRGIRYNPKKIENLENVLAPPYDVINSADQKRLYQKSDYNIVRLILGKTYESDNELNSRYTRAARDLNDWLCNEVLLQNDSECLYFYSQEYLFMGEKKNRIGFIARVKLEEFDKGVIYPHEFTLSKPKEDRLKLTRACRANFSQIFGLFPDPEKKIDHLIENGIKGQSLITIKDPDGIVNTFGKITSKDIIEKINFLMKDKKIYIADGHHRYETALAYRNEMRKKHGSSTEKRPYDYVMMYLTNMDSEGTSIFPIHRVLFNLDDFHPDPFIKSLEKNFSIKKHPFSSSAEKNIALDRLLQMMKSKKTGQFTFGVYLGTQTYYMLTLKDSSVLSDIVDNAKPKELFDLETFILHSLIIEKILGIKLESVNNQDHISYKKNEKEAIDMVDSGKCQLAFFLNPTKMEQIKNLARAGIRMPQKATYFYPKLLSGLVINPLT